MDLRSYEGAKFQLAEILRTVLAHVPQDTPAVEESARELFARLAEDRFNLLVAGRFSRGKSTLMNAILGMDRLPTGLLPLTSVITSVSYGSRERLTIRFDHEAALPHEVPLDQLPEYVTEHGNPGNRRRVRVAQIELPAEILRRGFYFVDSPGLGSAIAANTRTTEGFLPEADAVMLVSGFEGPLSEEEQQVVRAVAASRRRMFFVLNKHDTVAPSERATVKEYVQRTLQDLWAVGEIPRIFCVSARDALAAKLSGDAEALRASGLPELERVLMQFLIEEKGRAFLAAMCDRTAQLLSTCPITPEQRAPVGSRLLALRSSLSSTPPPEAPSMSTEGLSGKSHARMAACILCARVSGAVFDHLCHYQHQLASAAEAGERLAAEGGLCPAHWHLYVSLAADRDVCRGLVPLLRRVAEVLREGSAERLLQMRPTCALCAFQARAESAAIEAWLERKEDETVTELVCLPHLRKLALRDPTRARASVLSRHEAQAVERLAEDMERYVLKRDGLRRELTTEEEVRAARLALSFLAGHRNVLTDR